MDKHTEFVVCAANGLSSALGAATETDKSDWAAVEASLTGDSTSGNAEESGKISDMFILSFKERVA